MKQIIVVGAGAAGLFAAGRLAAGGARVLMVEHSPRPGQKILITGKGRCNVTNNCDRDGFLQGVRRGGRFLLSAYARFSSAHTMAFFEGLGVPLKTERGARVFPVSDSAADIRDALLTWAAPAQMVRGDVHSLLVENGRAAGVVLADGRTLTADGVLVCTGGLSYPGTGSTGAGYALAKSAGHTVVKPEASLVPLLAAGADKGDCAAMAGLSLRNVTLSLEKQGKEVWREQGELLFTHVGLSGPLVLSASAQMTGGGYVAAIDLKPALTEEVLYKRIGRDFEKYGARLAANALDDLLPQSLIPVAVKRWGIAPDKTASHTTREERLGLARLLKRLPFALAGKDGVERAVITAGGVALDEVEPKTMASKKLPGLYFAGEVLDADGYTGGFNLQIAFSTAAAAADALLAGQA